MDVIEGQGLVSQPVTEEVVLGQAHVPHISLLRRQPCLSSSSLKFFCWEYVLWAEGLRERGTIVESNGPEEQQLSTLD